MFSVLYTPWRRSGSVSFNTSSRTRRSSSFNAICMAASGRGRWGLAFDYTKWAQTRHPARQASVVNHIDHSVDILIRLGDLLEDAVAGFRAKDDSLVFEFFRFHARVAALLRRRAGHRAAGTVVHRAEDFFHGAFGAHQNVARLAHRAGVQRWLTIIPV